MQYATKKDLIEKYASKRKALNEEDVEGLLDCFIGYFNGTLGELDNKEIAYRIGNFGTMYDKDFDTGDLANEPRSAVRKRAEKKLQEYILTGMIKPKKIYIKDDRFLRI